MQTGTEASTSHSCRVYLMLPLPYECDDQVEGSLQYMDEMDYMYAARL